MSWISVKDRLPEGGEPVVVISAGHVWDDGLFLAVMGSSARTDMMTSCFTRRSPRSTMTAKPIRFRNDMIPAILDGRKTQTRRLMKSPPPDGTSYCMMGCTSKYDCGAIPILDQEGPNIGEFIPAPANPGDILDAQDEDGASFATLRVVYIRAERVREISHEDAMAEGAEMMEGVFEFNKRRMSLYQHIFSSYWDSIYPGSWSHNDWVWAYTFDVVEGER